MQPIERIFRSVDVLRLGSAQDVVDVLTNELGGYSLSLIAGAGALTDVLGRIVEGAVLVIEQSYYDADIRSEQKRLLDRISTLPSFGTPRIHVFRPEASLELLEEWFPTPGHAEQSEGLQALYLGYIVVRQHAGGSVGRTMLAPSAFTTGHPLRTRCLAVEEVDFFGRPLRVEAVPFMQQDGLVVSCFHVCLWMSAYGMTLSGYLPRSTSGFIGDNGTRSMRFPNRGVATDDVEELGRELGFSVRSKLLAAYVSQDEFERDLIHHLDSGLPVILVSDADPPTPPELPDVDQRSLGAVGRDDVGQHSILVCGYTRADDGTLDQLVYHDDRYGPYLTAASPKGIPALSEDDSPEMIEQQDAALRTLAWGDEQVDAFKTGLFYLAPQGVWLGGNQAAVTAVDAASAFCRGASLMLEAPTTDEDDAELLTPDEHAEYADFLKGLTEYVHMWGNLGQPHRAYAMLSVDYKRRYSQLNRSEPGIYRHLWGRSLPRYVWVVEWFDHDAWKSDKPDEPCVRAEAVLDASSPEAEERVFWMRAGRLVAGVFEGQGVPKAKWDGLWNWELESFVDEDHGGTTELLQRSCRRSNYAPFDAPPPLQHAMKGALRTGIS